MNEKWSAFEALISHIKSAQEQADEANDQAYYYRQQAIRAQTYASNSAAEAAILLSEIKLAKLEAPLTLQLEKERVLAMKNTVATVLQAADAVEKANQADREVTDAFQTVRLLAQRLNEALQEEN
jgi:hypothetical protein